MAQWTAMQLRPIIHIYAFVLRTPSTKEVALTAGAFEGLEKFVQCVARERTASETAELVELLKDAVLHTAYTCIRVADARVRKVCACVYACDVRVMCTCACVFFPLRILANFS
jgi:hypothetical protein